MGQLHRMGCLCTKGKRLTVKAVVLTSMLIFFNLLFIQNQLEKANIKATFEKDLGKYGNTVMDKSFEDLVTVIIYEFEEFENNLLKTVESILQFFPNINILLVCHGNPYPPLQFNSPNVKLINTDASIATPYQALLVEKYIATQFVMVVPDGLILDDRYKLFSLFWSLQDGQKIMKEVQISAMTDGSFRKEDCISILPNIRQWTISYGKDREDISDSYLLCDGTFSNVAILLKREVLFNFTVPLVRPYPTGIFIQAAVRNMKTVINKKIFFTKYKGLFNDPHNRLKHETLFEKRRKTMYQRFKIKKIVGIDGEIEWLGCNKFTSRCFKTVIDDTPSYLYGGLWTPPCCIRALRETAIHVFNILNRFRIRYWLEGGSLLGAVRNGEIIPWDYDVDIGIHQDDIAKFDTLAALHTGRKLSVTDKQFYVWEKATEGKFFRVQFSQQNHMHVDLFPFYEKNGFMTKDTWFKTHKQDMKFPTQFIKPLQKIWFLGMMVSAPNNYTKFLELKFGEGVIEHPQYPNPKKLDIRSYNRV